MTPASLKAAEALIDMEGLKAFSFDVFDTFLLRRATGPEGVYERAFHHAPVSASRRHMVESFVQQRIIAEHKARSIALELAGRPEATIQEIYDQFAVASFGLPRTARKELAAAEFQAELDLCFVNPDVLALLERARARGVKVGFLSDTYWSGADLARLLDHASPGLAYDFLYASCDHGFGKSAGLFGIYMRGEGLAAPDIGHIGDNPAGDVAVPRSLGVKTVHYPQASAMLAAISAREAHIVQALAGQAGRHAKRLDGGLHTLRRLSVATPEGAGGLADAVGSAVLGPVMVAFRNFVRARVAELKARCGEARVLFIARDGYLPMQLWDQTVGEEAFYVEINRRVVLVGCSDGIEPLQALFRAMRLVNAATIEAVLKAHLPRVAQFFEGRPDGLMTGAEFADAFPGLVEPEDISRISGGIRAGLVDYLRASVRGFDDCSDIIMVDLGYSGTMQRGLRGVFDNAGLGDKNIHGIYLATLDENYAELRETDSACGLLDDGVMTPMAKRVLLRNVSVVEQFCSAPVGSVFGYDGTEVVREEDIRPQDQLRLCSDVRSACLRFAATYDRRTAAVGFDPLTDGEDARLWTAAILSRFLLLPRLEEREGFGRLRQDINLGSKTLVDMIEVRGMEALMGTLPLDQLSQAKEPPMWLAGGLAALSPVAGFAYAYTAFGLAGQDVLADAGAGQISAMLVRNGGAERIPVGCAVTATGAVRLRIAVLKKHGGARVAVPLEPLFRHGLVVSAIVQQGATSAEALLSRDIRSLPAGSVQAIGADCDGFRFRITEADSHLVVGIPMIEQALAIVTLTAEPLPPLP